MSQTGLTQKGVSPLGLTFLSKRVIRKTAKSQLCALLKVFVDRSLLLFFFKGFLVEVVFSVDFYEDFCLFSTSFHDSYKYS